LNNIETWVRQSVYEDIFVDKVKPAFALALALRAAGYGG
jgi:hypothetical protein